jgi:hypothetical protein
MANLFQTLKQLLPDPPLLVGVVQSVELGGCRITLPDGGVVFARGVAQFGESVFVRDGMIEGLAPSLSVITINV